MKIPQQLKEAYRAAKAAEWEVTRQGDGHLRWKPPGSDRHVTTPGSEFRGGGHTVQNYLHKLRAAGLVLPASGGKGKAYKKRAVPGVHRAA